MDGFSLGNHGRLAKFAKLFPGQIIPLYGTISLDDSVRGVAKSQVMHLNCENCCDISVLKERYAEQHTFYYYYYYTFLF